MFTKNFNAVAMQTMSGKSVGMASGTENDVISIGGNTTSYYKNQYNGNVSMSIHVISDLMHKLYPKDYFVEGYERYSGYGVVFGDGNTAVTIDDFNLSGNPVFDFTHTVINESIETDDYFELKNLYTITNTSDSAITIGEIGLFSSFEYTGGAYYGNNCPFMIERTAFETPITIEPDGVGQVTYTIRMNKFIV